MRKVLIFSILINIILIVFFFIYIKPSNKTFQVLDTNSNDSEDYLMPWLNLPKNYFSGNDFRWGHLLVVLKMT